MPVKIGLVPRFIMSVTASVVGLIIKECNVDRKGNLQESFIRDGLRRAFPNI